MRKKVSHIDEGSTSKGYYTVTAPKNLTTPNKRKKYRVARSVNKTLNFSSPEEHRYKTRSQLARFRKTLARLCHQSATSNEFKGMFSKNIIRQTESVPAGPRNLIENWDKMLKHLSRNSAQWLSKTPGNFSTSLTPDLCECLQLQQMRGDAKNDAILDDVSYYQKCLLKISLLLESSKRIRRSRSLPIMAEPPRNLSSEGLSVAFPYRLFSDWNNISPDTITHTILKRDTPGGEGNVVPTIANVAANSAGKRVHDRVECWATNEVGSAQKPCIFIFKIVGE